jgi:hypothetical protein
MVNQREQLIELFLPKPEDPESIATVLPSYLLKREQTRSSTLDMEFPFSLLPRDRTFEVPQKVILPY